MPGGIERKWRPPLWFVLLGLVGVVLGLPLAGIVAVRFLYAPARDFAQRFLGNEAGAAILAFTLIFVTAYIAFRFVAQMLGTRTRASIVGPLDRLLGLGFGAFNRRIQDKVSRNEMDVLGAGAASGDQFAAFRAAGVRAAAEPAKWREALSQTATELHRAVEHGFLASEVNTAKAELLASLEQGAKSESTLPSRAYLDRINSELAEHGIQSEEWGGENQFVKVSALQGIGIDDLFA